MVAIILFCFITFINLFAAFFLLDKVKRIERRLNNLVAGGIIVRTPSTDTLAGINRSFCRTAKT